MRLGWLNTLAPHRRRLGRLALVLAVVAVALQLQDTLPQETQLELLLGPAHVDVVELRVACLQRGAEVHGVRLSFPSGAPAAVPVEADLPAGRFEVDVRLIRSDGSGHQVVRLLETPVDGPVRFQLDWPRREPGYSDNSSNSHTF